jgi:hypothetical protein
VAGGGAPSIRPSERREMELIELISPWVQRGNGTFRKAIATLAADAHGSLALSPTDVVPSPALFAHFAAPAFQDRSTIEQLILGSLTKNRWPSEIPAVGNASGLAHLPGVGFLQLHGDSGGATAGSSYSRGFVQLNRPVTRPTARCAGGRLEVLPTSTPVVELILTQSGVSRLTGLEELANRHFSTVQSACRVLQDLHPDLDGLLFTVLDQLVLFDDATCNSFAEPSYFGAAFCNMRLGTSAVYLVEDLVHQGGHNVLMAAAAEPEIWFGQDCRRSEKISTSDSRTLYVLWHGALTEALMVDTLSRWLARDPEDPELAHEIMGRYAFVLRRFATDVRDLVELRPRFTSLGQELVDAVVDVLRQHVSRNAAWVTSFDLAGQGYNFSWKVFRCRNSVPTSGRWQDDRDRARAAGLALG